MVNQVTLIGNLGADPETRQTQGGGTVCTLRVATTHRAKRGETWVDETEWHRVVCFGRTAENVGRFCRKGKQLYIQGRIQTRKWQDQSGQDRYSTEIVADVVRFLGGRDERAGSGEYSRGAPEHGQSNGGSDDDILF